jgi:preprotein translocase subunit SecD
VRLLEEDKMDPATLAAAAAGQVPFGTELYYERNGQPVIVKRQVVLTGDRINDAQPGFDGTTGEPAVHISLDGTGARIFQQVTRENVNKRMAILLFEKGKGEVVTAPVIRTEIGGGRVQISGRMTTREASDVALLLRAGALAAPMEIVEERTVGPSLGADNIRIGFQSMWMGFAAIALFIVSPLLAFIAALIKLDSKGKIFFRQERVGMDGRVFLCYKFRSMRQDADEDVHRERDQ